MSRADMGTRSGVPGGFCDKLLPDEELEPRLATKPGVGKARPVPLLGKTGPNLAAHTCFG